MNENPIYRLGFFWYNCDYSTFCNLLYDGKNDSYTQEKWNKFLFETMWYLSELGDDMMEKLNRATNEFYEGRIRSDA